MSMSMPEMDNKLRGLVKEVIAEYAGDLGRQRLDPAVAMQYYGTTNLMEIARQVSRSGGEPPVLSIPTPSEYWLGMRREWSRVALGDGAEAIPWAISVPQPLEMQKALIFFDVSGNPGFIVVENAGGKALERGRRAQLPTGKVAVVRGLDTSNIPEGVSHTAIVLDDLDGIIGRDSNMAQRVADFAEMACQYPTNLCLAIRLSLSDYLRYMDDAGWRGVLSKFTHLFAHVDEPVWAQELAQAVVGDSVNAGEIAGRMTRLPTSKIEAVYPGGGFANYWLMD